MLGGNLARRGQTGCQIFKRQVARAFSLRTSWGRERPGARSNRTFGGMEELGALDACCAGVNRCIVKPEVGCEKGLATRVSAAPSSNNLAGTRGW